MAQFLFKSIRLSVVTLSLIECLSSCNSTKGPDFAKDIGPIVHKNCSPCHQPGGAAPFSLLTYEDVRRKARMVAMVTQKGYMPPWPADRNYSHFINERGLSPDQISLIREWVENGCEPGDTNGYQIPADVFAKSVLGKPDKVIPVRPIPVEGNNRDRFFVLKIPYELDQARFVKAVEFIPGQLKYVHHVNGHYLSFTDETDPFKGNNLLDIESPNYDNEFRSMGMLNADGSAPYRVHSAFNYLPGAFGVKYPPGIGGFIMSKKGAFVANDIHFGPSRENCTDSSMLYLYFSDRAPDRPTFEFMMGTNGVSEIVPPLQIAANKTSHHVSRLQIYNDISVLTVNPHMHLIGTRFKAYAVKPNGDTIRLIHIPKWQFRWQYFYTFKNPVKIPKGSVVIVEADFDNTASNPNNPNRPPQTIGERLDRGGASMRTTDEMLQFIVTYMMYKPGDEQIDLEK